MNSNQNQNNDAHDDGLDELFKKVDPASDSNLNQTGWSVEEACQRIEIPSISKIETAEPSRSRRSAQYFVGIAASILALVVLGVAIWNADSIRNRLAGKSDKEEFKSEDLLGKSDRDSNDSLPDNPKRKPEQPKKKFNPFPINTAEKLLDLEPVQRWKLRDKIDHVAIKEEFGSWLENWHSGSPTLKRKLEEQFLANKELWQPMAGELANRWKNQDRNRANLSLLVITQDPIAENKLREARKQPSLALFCNELLFPLLPDQKLAEEIQFCQSCEELNQLLIQLAKRKDPTCTGVLIHVAGTKGCSESIRSIPEIEMVHLARAVSTLRSVDSDQKAAAVQFLTLAKSAQVEHLLTETIKRNRSTLPAISILLARKSDRSKNLLMQIQQTPALAAYLPSARQFINRTSFPYNNLNRKVCQSCLNP